MSGLADGTRVVVTGTPTAEEVAAVVVALDTALAARRAPSAPRFAWQVAARLESTGQRIVSSPWELPRP